ncbi:hypothetical protein [Vulgatibacter incomptus]|uniref:hypothetical protein n=1 Tax=Vulgatibacter incomptus TaxID=1391653 RepID=UPI0012FA2AA9|nr:hypothetical protein [Vulgatibacter incomptus]
MGEKLGVTSFLNVENGRFDTGMTAVITPNGDVYADRLGTIPGPATQLDLHGDALVYIKGRSIHWTSTSPDSFGVFPSGQIQTESLGCSSFHHPILGGSAPLAGAFYATPSYVIFEGRKCDGHLGSVLFLTDIRDPNSQTTYLVDEIMPSPATFQASFDTENFAVVYIRDSSFDVKFFEFSLP